MKKLIIACGICCSLALTSCVDLLQEPQSKPTPENIIYNKDMIAAKVNGLYTDLWHDNYGFNCRIAALSIGADDVITGSLAKVRTVRIDELRTETSGDDVKQLWANLYLVIYSANSIIKDITPNPGETMEVKKPYLGEAHFMRALSYFYLVRFFGDVPALTDPESKIDIFGNTTIIRNKTADIYEKIIIPDLKIAEEYLPIKSRTDDNSKATKWAAKACLADVYLTMAGWPLKQADKYQLAADKAKEIINKEGMKFSLMENYKDLWIEAKKTDYTEHIFALHHSTLDKTASQYGTSYLATEENGGWSDYLADPEFFNRFPNDTRKAFVYTTEFVKGTTITNWENSSMKAPAIRKYRGYGGCGNYNIEGGTGNQAGQSNGLTPIYRYADVLFIYAEAINQAKNGPDALAYTYINDIRKRANGGVANDLTPGLGKEAFAKAIFDERGWEFFCEFKRWFQLVRAEKVDEMNKLNPRINESGRLDCNKENYLMPVPDSQVELSGWTNNPGY